MNYRFRIDWKKWKNDVDVLLARREEWPKLVQEVKEGKKTQKEIGYYEPNWAAELTWLYSIRAHARGRLHRKYAKLTQYEWGKLGHKKPEWQEFVAANGKIKFELTMEDQAKYLDNGCGWKKYEKLNE